MSTLQSLLKQADDKLARLQHFREWDNESIRRAINVEYTYESNRIEGNTLTLRETDLVIHKGLTIGGKPLVEHLEAINHYEAVEFVRDWVQGKEPFNQFALLSLHGLILRSIDKQYAGRYRDIPVTISGSRHVPPQPWQVEKLMEDYFLFYQEQREQLHPVILAAEMHERLVTIHPFVDGNGRTARLVMNLVLMQHGFPLAIFHGDNEARLAYYDALEKCNVEEDKADFHQLVAAQVVEALSQRLRLVEA
ncbi:Fic family protein [Leucothrix arctica]|uniref:Fic family protein n=1 Tax=Leucothrix arctica TaxID=1481894 RepID=A0A317CHS0_9GAMM|nr:Fic family protein [Leucothrix arctica]PWQ97877.1 Fic family protein [Leucothrix arctica]